MTSIALLGCGVVGSELLKQLAALDHGPQLVALANSRRILLGNLNPRTAGAALIDADRNTPDRLESLLDDLSRRSDPVLVDATAADGHERLFAEAISRGIRVVTANKKPLAVSQRWFDAIRQPTRIETTVGAGLPVIDTLRTLRATGDDVLQIEGALSGTLGYIVSRLESGEKLSVAVREALAKGYTEPRPQEDLSGVDVARKALILARELGLELEVDDIEIEPLVPPEFLAIDDVDEFLASLRALDREIAEKFAGRCVRYLAVVTPHGVRVGLTDVDEHHATASLRGPEALVAFTTRRYSQPLVVRGPGAGGEVTAAGLLADILATGHRLRENDSPASSRPGRAAPKPSRNPGIASSTSRER